MNSFTNSLESKSLSSIKTAEKHKLPESGEYETTADLKDSHNESPTRVMMQPAPNLRPAAAWGRREVFVAKGDEKSILSPTICQQNERQKQSTRTKFRAREKSCPDLRPRTGNGFFTRKKTFEEQEDISRARAQQLCELFEKSDQSDFELIKMKILTA